ncbi:unnamed protein product [Mytilus coruscus]|uniref:B box-type domain-containing protein n=1 Tax=Mytilus coruscus TaxID=42192 RepID=A0A6J8D6I3_MYTCO|nr:unnamed protein product [Mytilus coruscus]
MAYFQSVHKSQIPINCHLCDSKKNIKWKCVDCGLFICDKCKEGRHLRIKNAQDHNVISIKDVGLHSEKLDFTNIKCTDHSAQSCCLFCKRCDSLVCPTCVSKVHKKHANDLIEISEAYNIKIDELKERQSNIKMEKEKAITRKKHLEQCKNAENAKYNKVIPNILNHGNALKKAIDKYIEELKDEVDEHLKAILKSIDTDLHNLSKSMEHSNEKNREVEILIKTQDVAKFFSEVGRSFKSNEVLVPKSQSSYNSIPNFFPGEITQSNVGVLQSEESPEKLSIAFKILQEYQTELSRVSQIIPCVDNSVWINSSSDGCIINAEPRGRKLTVVSNFKMTVYGMAITQSNNLLLSVHGKSRLQKLNITTGKLTDTDFDVDPLVPISIHTTSGNKVIVVGISEKLRRKAVFLINDKGDHETVYEHDKHNQPLFSYPRSITSTSNGNIQLVDFHKGKKGRVVVLVKGSDMIHSYNGDPKINKHKSFKPQRIVTTSRDNVMVTDLDTEIIHILNSNGCLISWYNTKDIGILHPFSLALTPTGQVYIGCTRQAGSTAKEAKIYEVTISGC